MELSGLDLSELMGNISRDHLQSHNTLLKVNLWAELVHTTSEVYPWVLYQNSRNSLQISLKQTKDVCYIYFCVLYLRIRRKELKIKSYLCRFPSAVTVMLNLSIIWVCLMYVFTRKWGSPVMLTFYTDCTKHATAGSLIHRQQTVYLIFTQTKLSSIYRYKLYCHLFGPL